MEHHFAIRLVLCAFDRQIHFLFLLTPTIVAGESCNIAGECFERGSMCEQKIVKGYRTLAGELSDL